MGKVLFTIFVVDDITVRGKLFFGWFKSITTPHSNDTNKCNFVKSHSHTLVNAITRQPSRPIALNVVAFACNVQCLSFRNKIIQAIYWRSIHHGYKWVLGTSSHQRCNTRSLEAVIYRLHMLTISYKLGKFNIIQCSINIYWLQQRSLTGICNDLLIIWYNVSQVIGHYLYNFRTSWWMQTCVNKSKWVEPNCYSFNLALGSNK